MKLTFLSENRARGSLKASLERLRALFAQEANKILEAWDDEEGGACDAIAEALGNVAVMNVPGIDITEGGHDGDDHAYIMVYNDTECCILDIDPYTYETGGGYNWKLIPGAVVHPEHIIIHPVNRSDLDL